jgi:hypothetical protein
MDPSITELERAFQLAKSGDCRTVDEIRKKLSQEGYYATQVTGKVLLRQLQAIIAAGLEARNLTRERGNGMPSRKDRPHSTPEKMDHKRSARNRIPVESLNASSDG